MGQFGGGGAVAGKYGRYGVPNVPCVCGDGVKYVDGVHGVARGFMPVPDRVVGGVKGSTTTSNSEASF